MPLLIPGIGAQGGDIEAVLANGLTADKTGLVINVSRAIINAVDNGQDFARAAADKAEQLNQTINHLRV